MTYFYGRRQGNGCEIKFPGLLYAREVLISRTVAHKCIYLVIQHVHGLGYKEDFFFFNFTEKVTLDKMSCLFSGS
jgi:hypothetical protein